MRTRSRACTSPPRASCPSCRCSAALGGFTRFSPASAEPAKLPNLFSAGREIGDEYRYILERRYAKLFPGNMLTRPGPAAQSVGSAHDRSRGDSLSSAVKAAGATRGGRGAARRSARPQSPRRRSKARPVRRRRRRRPTSTSSPTPRRCSTICARTRTASCASSARRSATGSTCRFMRRISANAVLASRSRCRRRPRSSPTCGSRGLSIRRSHSREKKEVTVLRTGRHAHARGHPHQRTGDLRHARRRLQRSSPR